MEILNNTVITIGGHEVDTTVRSHKIDGEVMTAVNRVVREKGSKSGAAKYFGIARDVFYDTVRRKSCRPDTYLQILNTLYPQNTDQ